MAVAEGVAKSYYGSSWSAPVDLESPTTDISGPTSSFCAVIGSSGWAVTYHAGTWSSPVDVYAAGFLRSVSCASEDFCVAVGEEPQPIGKKVHSQKMAQYAVYDGNSWSAVSGVPGVVRLQNVSCLSSTFCLATSEGQMASFNGSTWSSPTGLPLSPKDISCVSETFCAAIDEEGEAATFNGSSWSSPSAIAPKIRA